MKYTEEIFNLLSRGGFISNNSVSPQVKRYYDLLEENFPDYYDYYQGIGLYLEAGDGYYYFTRREAKVDMERKLEAAGRWIDYLSFLKTFHSAFGPGFLFRTADIEIQIGCDMELKEKATKLFSDKKTHSEVVEKLVKELLGMGFIEKENEVDGTYKVLSSFHYIEELVDCITIAEEVQDEIPE
ncbi:MAG: hypothetical protein Q4D56_10065 [Bacteroides sp.]|nr:hypothetical protein [Bacteroides sp.]